jgi:hypothetical protein
VTYTWETGALDLPWETGLFPRMIAVHRSKTVAVSGGVQQIGNVGYSGREESTSPSDPEGEIVLFTGISASIEAVAIGRTRGGIVPADAAEKPQWRILVPVANLAQYSVRDRDIIVDDEAYRYIVVQAWFTPLGYQLACIRLEA